MKWKASVIAVLALAFGAPAFAEDLPDGQEKSSEEEAAVDQIALLEGAIGHQRDAEKGLADAEVLAKSIELQEKAIERMTAVVEGSKLAQDAAIRDLETLIRSAKDFSSSSSTSASQERKTDPSGKDSTKTEGGNPARRTYLTNGSGESDRTFHSDADLGGRWGGLPAILRDELSQSADEFLSIKGRYSEKLIEYSKLISRE